MLEELRLDGVANTVYAISVANEKYFAGENISINKTYQNLPDRYLVLPFTLFGQIVSLLTAVKVDNTPDDPSANITVNRVVECVKIHRNID